MTDHEKARHLFQTAGLAFPEIPEELAVKLKERGEWLFSTRDIEISPYDLWHYVEESDSTLVDDYAILCHSGHGVNSYAIHYYLVRGELRLFLQLGWGGVYMDAQKAAADIGWCFGLADEIVWQMSAVPRVGLQSPLEIVGSDFQGSHWFAPRKGKDVEEIANSPGQVLAEALQWLKAPSGFAFRDSGLRERDKG
jgi:hypothetical protein